jgi:ATP adenylyltransferase
MDRLWAPWRRKFIYQTKPKGCIFCEKPRGRSDAKSLILDRGERVFSMLNLYPYNNGHLMVAPYRHLRSLELFDDETMSELWRLAKSVIRRLNKVVRPHGYNVGFNIGHTAGAGFVGHAHLHIVPRWNGDTNFMPVLGGTKVISESLAVLRKRLLACRA